MQLSSNFYKLHCYMSNCIFNNQFLANFEMSQSLPFLMNMFLYLLSEMSISLVGVEESGRWLSNVKKIIEFY